MNIKITKAEVYEEVATLVGYIAKQQATKADAPENTFRRTAIFDPYRTLLDDVFERGCNHLTDAIGSVAPYTIGQCDEGQEDAGYCIDCSMPTNWNNALEDEVARTAKSYLVNHVASMWMRIIESADEDKYSKDSTTNLLEFSKLLHRKRRVSRCEFKQNAAKRREMYNHCINHC